MRKFQETEEGGGVKYFALICHEVQVGTCSDICFEVVGFWCFGWMWVVDACVLFNLVIC